MAEEGEENLNLNFILVFVPYFFVFSLYLSYCVVVLRALNKQPVSRM
jgi:hypothetical protein